MSARDVISVMGIIFSVLLFVSPGLVFSNMARRRSVEGYSFEMHAAFLLNSLVWLLYGTVHPDSLAVIAINAFGVAAQCVFAGFYLWLAVPAARRRALSWCAGALLIAAGVAGIGFGFFHRNGRENWFGSFGAFTGLCMYLSPMLAVRTVIQTNSVRFMSASVAVTSLGNSLMWTVYAFLSQPHDIFVAGPNVGGILCALVQLAVYVWFKNAEVNNANNNNGGGGVGDGVGGGVN